jgi:hypothetical protein
MQPIDVVAEQMVRWYGADSWLAHLEKAQHFDITNVSKYSDEFEEKKPLSEISFAVPPWPVVYAESDEGNGRFVVFVVKTIEHSKDDARAWTIDIHMMTVKDNATGLEYRGKVTMTRDGRVSEQTDWESEWAGKWIRALDLRAEIVNDWRQFAKKRAEQRERIAALEKRMPSKAKLIRQFDEEIKMETPEEATSFLTDSAVKDLGKDFPDNLIMIFFLATMLANCKNVVTSSEPVPPKLVKARKRKDRIAVERWYTLRIEPMQKKIRHTGIEGGDLPSADNHLTYERAWHICRGHFKEFKPERPLFGRVTGRFWWPSMVRGSKEKGIVHKDYELGDATESTTEGTTSQRSTVAEDESARSAQSEAHETDASAMELATQTRTNLAGERQAEPKDGVR